jgi:hypothetical protein
VPTAYEVTTTPFIVILDLNPNNSQTYLKWVLGVVNEITLANIGNCKKL